MVAAGDFGWGSAGKLHLILDQLGDVPVVGFGTGLDRRLLDIPDQAAVSRVDTRGLAGVVVDHDVAAALVVGAADVARVLIDVGLPVVVVDSLPYLWTENDAIPVDAAVYCAQQCVSLPALCWPVLRRVENLRWIGAITPEPGGAGGGGGVVVNVGGLHSALSADAADAYAGTVLPPVLDGLCDAGRRVTAVCGNIPPDRVELLAARVGPGVPVGPMRPADFADVVRGADLLVTSPGSTTLLQAQAARTPVLMLPPQNVSQVLNAEWFAGADARRMSIEWPTGFDRRRLDELRPLGEDEAVRYVYGVVRQAAADPSTYARLRGRTRELALEVISDRRDHLDLLDNSGARQVAQLTRRVLLAARRAGPRPWEPGRGRRTCDLA